MKKLSLIAALALGSLLACSTLVNAQDAKPGKGNKGKGHMTVEQRLDQMTKDLSLTDEQKPKVKAVLEETDKKLQEVPREDRQAKMPEIMKERNAKLKDILTPEQFTKLQESRKKGPGGENKKAEKKTE